MPFWPTGYHVLIASPSDVGDERQEIRRLVFDWNDVHVEEFNAVRLPVMWETHARPRLGKRPQSLLYEQFVRDADILIGIFWTRLGTSTGQAESGTVEEIREFLAQGKPALG